MGITSKKKSAKCLNEVRDCNGVVQSGEGALKVWSEHFKEMLQVVSESSVGCSKSSIGVGEVQGEQYGRGLQLDVELTHKEVMWAWGSAKKGKSPGKDGITIEMMRVEVLSEVWVSLFNVCWKFGVVSSLWTYSIIVPIPKSKVTGVCNIDNFRDISLTSLVGKMLCMILNRRLTTYLQAEGILAEEQGGFRSSRSCRDQILSLLLISQTMVAKKSSGLLTAFIDFKKAYDRVDRERRCGIAWGRMVLHGGRFLAFLKGLYQGSMPQVRIEDRLGEDFVVTKGLRQGWVLSPVLFSLYINSLVSESCVAWLLIIMLSCKCNFSSP